MRLTYSHVGASDSRIGNHCMERGDANKLNSTCKAAEDGRCDDKKKIVSGYISPNRRRRAILFGWRGRRGGWEIADQKYCDHGERQAGPHGSYPLLSGVTKPQRLELHTAVIRQTHRP